MQHGLKSELEQLLRTALQTLAKGDLPGLETPERVHLERTRDARHGDFASNAAMALAKSVGRKPRDLAEAIVAALPSSDWLDHAEVAGPGFINLFLTPQALHAQLEAVLESGPAYGRSGLGAGRRVLLEFVSANPTGPLHVGHGRGAAYGDSVAALLNAAGYAVTREYYVNDAGRQMDILAVSVWLRYLESCGEDIPFPGNAYQGDYIRETAQELRNRQGEELKRPARDVLALVGEDLDAEKHIDALIQAGRSLLGEAGFGQLREYSLKRQQEGIRQDLADFGVHFDDYFSERALVDSGAVQAALERLHQAGHTYEHSGAIWFRSSDFGDEKDRVVVRDNGQPTYFASDIAYHLDKLERGFRSLVNIWGADHHGYVARLAAAVQVLSDQKEALKVQLVQFVSLFRGSEKLSMSTRAGEYVTLRELRQEVGTDAARFFYVLRSHDQHLDFDLQLATSRSNDNPVYYIQYAHARVQSVFRQLSEKGWSWDREAGRKHLDRLDRPHESALLSRMSRYPEIIEQAAQACSPHTLAHYLRDLADDFHSYYNAHTFLVEDDGLRNARLSLTIAVQQVIRNGLQLLGVSAPESM